MKSLFALCAAAFVLSGCAGLATPFINNPYAGTYSGTYTDSTGRSGPASIQLTKLGNVFGTLTDTATNVTGDLTGSVKSGLAFGGDITWTGSPKLSLSGTLASHSGNVTGTLRNPDGYSLKLDVAKPTN